jgi:LmbE family N-acetylglucosaminyl deacetylase
MKLLIAPHPDDETLFAAYTIMAEKPLVAVFNFKNRTDRNEESVAAMKFLGAKVVFIDSIHELGYDFESVYAPALQGGHPWHDAVCKMAIERYGERVIYYATYERGNLQPYGRFLVNADAEMKNKKHLALLCYKSQRVEYPWHFELENKNEYFF